MIASCHLKLMKQQLTGHRHEQDQFCKDLTEKIDLKKQKCPVLCLIINI